MSQTKPTAASPVQPGSVLHRLMFLMACHISNGLGQNAHLDTNKKGPKRAVLHYSENRHKRSQ